MKQIYKGKLKLRIAKENPYYRTEGRTLHKVLFYKFGISISLWLYHDGTFPEYSEWALEKINKIFPGADIDKYFSNVHWNGNVYYRDSVEWMLSNKLDLKPTKCSQVMFDEKTQKDIGLSHRARASFGIGDMLFKENLSKKQKLIYYKSRKYRRKFLLTLLEFHIKNNWSMFEDLCEDEIIGHGIMSIVPYRERGIKKRETKEEAFTAAKNFAEYVS